MYDYFGSMTVPPAGVGYQNLTLANDITFVWPNNYNGTQILLSPILDITSSKALSLTLPDSTKQTPGFSFLLRNYGSFALTLKSASGATVATVASGKVVYLYLADNATADGVYTVVQFGVGTSSADAATLVGLGIKAIGASLNQSHVAQTVSSSSFTVDGTYRSSLVVCNGGAATCNLTSVSVLQNDFFFFLRNSGTGTVTVDPAGSETIDGQATMSVQPGESLMLICSGSAWYSVGYGRSVQYQFTQLVKDVSAGGTFTLSATEAANKMMTFSGNPSSSATVVVPATVAVYYLQNSLTTNQSVTVKTSSGTGVAVPQNSRIIAMCDATNVVAAQSVQANTSVALIDGTSALPALSFSSTPSTGIYKYGATGFGVAVAGAAALGIDATVAVFAAGLRVGVGATPAGSQRLLVKQQVGDSYTVDMQGSSTDTSLRFINDLNTVERAALIADSNNALSVRTNGSNALVIDTNKNISIGTGANPAAGSARYLDVWNQENTNAASSSTLRLITQNAAGSAIVSADIMKNKAGAFYFNNNEPTASGYYAWALNSSEKMRLNSAGLGVFNSNPGYPVDIGSGTGQMVLRINGANSGTAGGSAIYLFLNGGAHAIGNYSAITGSAYNSDFTLYTGSSSNLLFCMGGAEKARIDTNGKLLIGYTTSQNSAKFQVNGSQYINNSSSFVPGNTQVTNAASITAGSYGGGYVMVDGTYYLGMYSISGELWFGLGTSAGLNGKVSVGANDLKYYGAAQGNIQSNANNGYAAFSAVSSGTNSAYIFFNNGTGERNRIVSDNNGALSIYSGASATLAFYIDNALNAQNYGDQYVIGNSSDATTRQKRLHFQSNIRNVYLCLNSDNSFNLLDQSVGMNRWITDTAGNFTAYNNVYGKALLSTSGKSGYDTGSGGSVTQTTDKTTAVTLNKVSGRIILAPSNILANTWVTFTLNNSYITESDVIIWTICPSAGGSVGTPNYRVSSGNGVGACAVKVENLSGVNLAQAFAVQFVIIKASEV